jgi:hypothetical protein
MYPFVDGIHTEWMKDLYPRWYPKVIWNWKGSSRIGKIAIIAQWSPQGLSGLTCQSMINVPSKT